MLSSLGHHFLIYKCRSLYMIIVSLKEYSCFAKMVCQSLKNVNKELPYDPKIPLLDIHWRVVVVVVESFSHVRLWQPHGLVARQAPLSMGFSRQEYLSGLPFPFPGDLFHPGIEPTSPALRQIIYRLNYEGIPYTQEKWKQMSTQKLIH